MLCEKCGEQNKEDAVFCNKCGNKISESGISEAAATEENVEEPIEKPIEVESITEDSAIIEEPIAEKLTTIEEPIAEELTTIEEPIAEKLTTIEEPIVEKSLNMKEPVINEEYISEKPVPEKKISGEQVQVISSKSVKQKVKGFKGMKFALGFITILLSFISAGTMFIDMFIMQYDSAFSEITVNYIKGTDIFKMINDFGELNVEVKNFVIVAIIMMILVIGISLVQFFITILWRTKGGYITVIFLSILAIFSEAIMTGMFFKNYVMNEYDALGIIGYGPVIAIVSHFIIIIVANVTRKLTKINAIVNN